MRWPTVRLSRFYVLASIAAAALAALTALSYLRDLRARAAEVGRLVEVVVAARDLEAGEILDDGALKTVPFPDRYLLAGTFTDPSLVKGSVLHHSLRSGEPILASALLSPAEDWPSAVLEPGFRAYPIPSSRSSFPPSLLYRGCRVDVISTRAGVARLLLEDVEVLGVLGGGTARQGETGLATSQQINDACLILKVTPEESCLLASALEEGQVELVLRPEN